jgi:hypothetical protein
MRAWARGRVAMAAAGAMLVLASADPVRAQLPGRLAGEGDGIVRFTLPLRDDVRMCGNGIRTMGRSGDTRIMMGRGEGSASCREGVAAVEVTIREGRVAGVDLLTEGGAGASDVRDLGRFSAPEAAAAMLAVARAAPAGVAEDALVAAVVTDSVVVWPDLLEIARNRTRPEDVRRSALFWLGQEAAVVVTRELRATAVDGTEERGIREAAVFALSQRPAEESVPVLMDLARTAPDADTREHALFWLAQSDDPRVPEFFGALLRGP